MILSAAIGSASSGFATAQVRPEEIIKNRKSNLTLVQTHMRSISAILKGERPMDAALIATNAALIDTLAQTFQEGFPAGTGVGDTKSKPEIWSQAERFTLATKSYQSESRKFNEVARTGNVDAMKAQFGKLAKACASCHEDFRNR